MSRPLVVVLLISGCSPAATRSEPWPGTNTTTAELREVPVRGFDVTVELEDDDIEFEGELLAVDGSQLFLLVGARTRAIPWSRIYKVNIVLYGEGSAGVGLGVATALGAISTLSHGMALVLTAPVWVVTGIPATAAEASRDDVDIYPEDFHHLVEYARFPQGLPPDWSRLPGLHSPPAPVAPPPLLVEPEEPAPPPAEVEPPPADPEPPPVDPEEPVPPPVEPEDEIPDAADEIPDEAPAPDEIPE